MLFFTIVPVDCTVRWDHYHHLQLLSQKLFKLTLEISNSWRSAEL